MNPARRTLKFATLDQVMPDVDRLLSGGSTVGKWSLGQICNHLTGAIIASIEGYPAAAPWALRKSIGPLIIKRVLKVGTFAEGIKVPQAYLPKPCEEPRAEAEALRAAVRLFAAHPGPFAEHPLGAKLGRAEWERFHCIHCAHHLSFVLPEPNP